MNEKSIKKHLQKDATLSAGALLTINYLILYFFLPQFPHFSTPILPQFYSNLGLFTPIYTKLGIIPII